MEFKDFQDKPSRMHKESMMEHKAVSLLERGRITYDADALFYSLTNPKTGALIFKAAFHDYEHHSKMVHQRRVVDEAIMLGREAFKNQIRNPENCEKMLLLLSSDTNWWVNHTERSARHLLLEKWSEGWLDEQHTQFASQDHGNESLHATTPGLS